MSPVSEGLTEPTRSLPLGPITTSATQREEGGFFAGAAKASPDFSRSSDG
jgi:hypothetical protein